jgi:signal transduction histidine kinase
MTDKTIRVLLIEDNPGDARLIQAYLVGNAKTGPAATIFDLDHTSSLGEGLERVIEGEYDILLLDLNLPDSRGLETFNRIHTAVPNVPVIVLTGLNDENLALQALQDGAQDYLIKGSVDTQLLARAIQYAIERQQVMRDLRETNLKLSESEARFRKIIKASIDGIVILNRENEILFLNPSAEKLLGKGIAELRDQKFDYQVELNDAIEIDVHDKEGPDRAIEMRSVETEWEGQSVYLATMRDISERKRVEEAEKELMKLKDDFLASVSHDLKTPLFTVIGFLEMLDDGRLSEPAARDEFLERAIYDADRLKALVDDILDMTRFEAGRLKLTIELIDVSNLVSEALASIDLLATSKGVALKSTPPEGAVGIQGDRQRLLRVLINLLENAIKVSKSGQPIEVSWNADNGDVEINVIDQGPGIPRKDQLRVFEKFYQVERPGNPSSTGSGLGLYISNNFVEVHGGTLSVKSKLGKGSTFTIQLPIEGKDAPTNDRKGSD